MQSHLLDFPETIEVSMLTDGILPEILDLNFSMIKMKLCHSDDGVGWTEEQCEFAELQYKRFLTLLKLYPEKSIVPNKTMDVFWHYHILDTRKYHKDCENIFGGYVHHFPYFGLRGEEDRKNLLDTFQQTVNLFRLHFGFEMNGNSVGCGNDGGNCVQTCSNQNCSR
jgi:hypothetical protein